MIFVVLAIVGAATVFAFVASGGTNGVAFTTIDAPNGTDPEATVGDTLVLVEGANISITGDASTDSITIAAVTGAETQNIFATFAVPSGTNPEADTTSDTLTLTSSGSTMSITGDSATDTINFDVLTAPALSLDPSDCVADTKADAIDAEGDLACTSVDTGDILNDTIGFADIDYSSDFTTGGGPVMAEDECYFTAAHGTGGFICEGSTADDSEQLYLLPDLNGADSEAFFVTDSAVSVTDVDGRSLTVTTNTLNADPELYTDTHTLWLPDPTASDDLLTIWAAISNSYTITSISCESDQTVNFDLQVDDGTPAGVNGSDIACTTFATDSTLAGDTVLSAGERLDLAIASVSGTPTWVSIIWETVKND